MIELPEHTSKSCTSPAISLTQQELIANHLGNRLSVNWLSDDRVQIRSSSWVGTIQLTPDLHIRVVPKLAGSSLGVLTMLAITDGSPLAELPQYFRGLSDDATEDATELLCRLVVVHTEKVLARGLIRNYRGHAADLPFLRGRLDTYRQATVHFGRFTEFACDFNEFDRDTADNHLLLAGVRAARHSTTDAGVRRRAAEMERQLADVAPTLPPQRKLLAINIVYGRRNDHYRKAHTWCRSLLRLGRLDDSDAAGTPQIPTFLINMNSLFEKFVEWLIARVYDGADVDLQAQRRNPSLITVNGQYRRPIAPDLVVAQPGRSFAIDAKYKRYDEWEISISDVYQLLLYAQCYSGFTSVPASYLIYPASKHQTSPVVVELTVPAEDGPRHVRVIAIGIPLADVVDGLRAGDHDPLAECVQGIRGVLPGVSAVSAGRELEIQGFIP